MGSETLPRGGFLLPSGEFLFGSIKKAIASNPDVKFCGQTWRQMKENGIKGVMSEATKPESLNRLARRGIKTTIATGSALALATLVTVSCEAPAIVVPTPENNNVTMVPTTEAADALATAEAYAKRQRIEEALIKLEIRGAYVKSLSQRFDIAGEGKYSSYSVAQAQLADGNYIHVLDFVRTDGQGEDILPIVFKKDVDGTSGDIYSLEVTKNPNGSVHLKPDVELGAFEIVNGEITNGWIRLDEKSEPVKIDPLQFINILGSVAGVPFGIILEPYIPPFPAITPSVFPTETIVSTEVPTQAVDQMPDGLTTEQQAVWEQTNLPEQLAEYQKGWSSEFGKVVAKDAAGEVIAVHNLLSETDSWQYVYMEDKYAVISNNPGYRYDFKEGTVNTDERLNKYFQTLIFLAYKYGDTGSQVGNWQKLTDYLDEAKINDFFNSSGNKKIELKPYNGQKSAYINSSFPTVVKFVNNPVEGMTYYDNELVGAIVTQQNGANVIEVVVNGRDGTKTSNVFATIAAALLNRNAPGKDLTTDGAYVVSGLADGYKQNWPYIVKENFGSGYIGQINGN